MISSLIKRMNCLQIPHHGRLQTAQVVTPRTFFCAFALQFYVTTSEHDTIDPLVSALNLNQSLKIHIVQYDMKDS